MKIVISHAHPSISKGGAEISAYTLYKGFLNLGEPAVFIAMCPLPDIDKVVLESFDEYIIPYDQGAYDHFYHMSDPLILKRFSEILDKINPEEIIFHHFLFIGINVVKKVCEKYKCKKSMVLHEFLSICHHHGQMVTNPTKTLCEKSDIVRCAKCFPGISCNEFNIRKEYFQFTFEKIDRLVSPSEFLKGRFVEWGIPEEKMSVIENGLNVHDDLSGNPIKTVSTKISKLKNTTFGYFGQINQFKGVDLILDALDLINKSDSHGIKVRVHGNIIGVGDDFKEKFFSAVSKGWIDYLGPYNNVEVIKLMKKCDFILMASKWWENSPVVIQEAFYANRPLIVPNIGGMAEKVKDDVYGQWFNFNDAESLAMVMLESAVKNKKYNFPKTMTAQEMAKQYLTQM